MPTSCCLSPLPQEGLAPREQDREGLLGLAALAGELPPPWQQLQLAQPWFLTGSFPSCAASCPPGATTSSCSTNKTTEVQTMWKLV